MPRSEWTSTTLPKMPEIEDVEKRADVWFARFMAQSDLLRAETAEYEASKLRQSANVSAQHYKEALEALHGTLFDE